MPTLHESEFQGADGISLFQRTWTPSGEARCIVCLVHGLGEHGRRYLELASAFSQASCGFVTFDLRGHGKSPGQRGHVPQYSLLLDDIDAFLKGIAGEHPGIPLLLYGHSLGGNLVLNYVLRRNPSLAGAIVTSPGLAPTAPPSHVELLFGRLMAFVYPRFSMPNKLDLSGLSRDVIALEKYMRDPLVHDKISVKLGLEVLRAGQWAIAHASELSMPLLLMHGTADRITSAPATETFSRRAGALCKLKLWDGYYHELHNEPEKEAVFQYVLNWIDDLLHPGGVDSLSA